MQGAPCFEQCLLRQVFGIFGVFGQARAEADELRPLLAKRLIEPCHVHLQIMRIGRFCQCARQALRTGGLCMRNVTAESGSVHRVPSCGACMYSVTSAEGLLRWRDEDAAACTEGSRGSAGML